MDGPDFGICVRRQKTKQLMLALDWISLGAALTVPARPDTGEKGERTCFAECEPGWRLARLCVCVFAKRIERNDAAIFRL